VRLSERQSNGAGYWRIPGTSIALTDQISGSVDPHNYYFSAQTIAEIPSLYEKIKDFKAPAGEFFTPDFYRSFATTPGYILPPKWYLMLPAWLRADLLERMLLGQTLVQLLMTLVIALLFLL
jgi:MscS family membrane protein